MSIFNPEQWSKNHFEQANTGDCRRTKRLVDTASDMARCSGKSIALSCQGNEAKQEGAYRLMRNDAVSPEVIRCSGFDYTATQAQLYSEILAVDDTTSLSYKHQVASELGKLGSVKDKARGQAVYLKWC